MATYYKRDTNPTNNNWNQNDNWSTVSSTSATNTGTFPVNGDTVIFDANSIQVTVNVASACTSINFTGYTNTITMTNGLTVAGNVTLDSGMTISGAGNLTISATSTYDSNGKTWPNTLRLSGTITVTLAENATVQNLATVSAGTTSTLNSNNIYVLGNISITGFLAGTTTINAETTAATTGTWSWATSGSIANNFKINPSGTFVISGNVYYQTGTLEYVAGTVTVTGSTINFNGSCTVKSNGFTWGSFAASAVSTITLSDNCTCLNLTGALTFNNNSIFVTGNLSTPGASIGGTATMVLSGTGTWTGQGLYGITCPLTINTTGTITLTNTCVFAGGTFTYTAGTISPGTSTLEVYAGTTYSIASGGGMTLYNYFPRPGTHTINTGTITVNNNLTFNGNTTFAGTGGWTVNNLTDSTAGRTLTLKDGSTYTVTGTLSLTGTNASRWTIASSSATLRALLTLNQGASQSLIYVNGTRIDSSAGQTVWSLGGTLTDTVNWNNGSRPAPFNSIRMG